MWYWLFKYVFLGPLLYVIGRPKTQGLEHLPSNGSAILASNHLAVMDSFFLPLMVRRRITFLAKQEYFTGTGVKGRFLAWFYTVVGQVPIDRTDADSAQAALDTAKRILDQGKLLGMYPEGTRSPDGRLYKGKTGLARLALETGVPVIPVAMVGTNVVNPPGARFLRSGKVEVRFGKPMDFSRFDGMAGNRFIERAVIDEVMYALMELSGQEYVDVYAASLKETAAPELPSPTSSRLPESAAG
ncbi:1-acyl-sn-glycerol-3-phosphate acyltransferase [Mycolicibacterium insubricum]|uniref:1-acyl-sn-glycerol-3-phosphate acyltransferase n=1 Tax=Mycolicibacterium insubricum TaxID=444597 RepID=A0A1X0DJ75_9MYCO|nr:lysophospholipid acyltransferase family protein [Mycolicibacterium insubricum]MCB9441319.1 1-acyl-sn-glycerol-3-phosphate acyltransferase [Mycolicibacterium sp.]MCV7083150.1 1-acyl-sn-glycerol-3-phosphate acyltransferase [Mycolicibacterium insubricum]ORA72395.1 1-acyl-sn-glycerol-3-phosphate acyltransferase [Mycolicibacterium insubricum]BBZ67703.1 1-acyl-sn-glycerol-3-phosphate acyltransferase [Mycolicibacterium insubricum]